MSYKRLIIITTHDMHSGGEPLRIIESGYPELIGTSVLEKRDYAKRHLDDYRKILMNEPRGHKDMYGAIVDKTKNQDDSFDVFFIHNEGYSSMCGHAVIALGRYVIDKGLVKPTSPETEVTFNCPCGPVKARVEFTNGLSGCTTFLSVPAFVYKMAAEVYVTGLGNINVDIAFGGAFYAIISDKSIGLNLKSSSLSEVVKCASIITEHVKQQITVMHPTEKQLSFLYGTIVTDGNDRVEDGSSTNICVFADKQVDRSPTGSGVTARIALQYQKKLISLHQSKEFKSLIGTSFSGKPVNETIFEGFPAVIVEVSGMAYHTGDHTFYLEDRDTLGMGFQLDR